MLIQHVNTVPHLTTALNGPLQHLESLFLQYQGRIETWFRNMWLNYPAPFYTSVDLRNSGFKLAPVDTNLFPAGFNNLNPAFFPLCIQAVQALVEHKCPKAAQILIIPENHTRNKFYLESLATLQEIITRAGFLVNIGSTDPELKSNLEIKTQSGKNLTIYPLIRENNRLRIEGFEPCLILLNNDLSAGVPQILANLDQLIMPPTDLGWVKRKKSIHFSHYRDVALEFSQLIGIDSWLIDPLFRNCGKINFKNREGESCLAENVEHLLNNIQKKYDQNNIKQDPFVIIKADAGTYGMGVMTVHSPDQVIGLNRKQRNKMAFSKEGLEVSGVILQEGVYTFETWKDPGKIAEPVIYMIDHYVVGGFYRVHSSKSFNENLNSPGMEFEPLAFAESCNAPNHELSPDAEPNRFYAYGVIARLAQLAAAREIAAQAN